MTRLSLLTPSLRIVIAATAVALALALPGNALAFGVLGHQVVAAIAMRHSGDAALSEIRELLRAAQIAGGDLVRASSYPDEYRIGRPETGPWHFVNVPLDALEYSEDRDCHLDFQFRRTIETPCVVAQILSAQTRLGDRRLPAAVRGLAAAMLVHFVGDVHQPLHAASNRDRGGNAVAASWFGEPTNLHAVWDVKILDRRHGVYGAGIDPHAIAATLDARFTPDQRKALCNSSSIDWANESVVIARDTVYRFEPGTPVVLSEAYFARASAVVDERLARAGVRLACAIRGALE